MDRTSEVVSPVSPTGEDLGWTIWDLDERARAAWGREAQDLMVFEEQAELIVALAQHRRGRLTAEDVVLEAADAIITAVEACVSVDATPDTLNDALRAKLDRMRDRITKHEDKRTRRWGDVTRGWTTGAHLFASRGPRS